jgi:hypothetical protein
VHSGELESWIDLGIRNKRTWIIKALEFINNDNNRCPQRLYTFLDEILKHFVYSPL